MQRQPFLALSQLFMQCRVTCYEDSCDQNPIFADRHAAMYKSNSLVLHCLSLLWNVLENIQDQKQSEANLIIADGNAVMDKIADGHDSLVSHSLSLLGCLLCFYNLRLHALALLLELCCILLCLQGKLKPWLTTQYALLHTPSLHQQRPHSRKSSLHPCLLDALKCLLSPLPAQSPPSRSCISPGAL